MKLNQKIAQFVEVLKESNLPGLIMSSPGYGKTSTLEMYCRYKGYNLTTLIASQYSSDDILGLQSVSEGRLVRLTPAWYNDMIERSNNGSYNILFIDELSTCDEFIQAPLLNLIFNKSLGLHKLPENTLIIAAGNYSDDLNGAFNMTLPLINRFMILNLSVKDFDFYELINGSINDIDDSELGTFLGLNERNSKVSGNCLDRMVKAFRSCDLNNKSIKNSSESGLIGFASMRSLDYSRRYLTAANNLGVLNSNALHIVSDTLGEVINGGSIYDELEQIKVEDSVATKRSNLKEFQRIIDQGTGQELEALVDTFIKQPELVTESIYAKLKSISNRIPGKFSELQNSLTKFLG